VASLQVVPAAQGSPEDWHESVPSLQDSVPLQNWPSLGHWAVPAAQAPLTQVSAPLQKAPSSQSAFAVHVATHSLSVHTSPEAQSSLPSHSTHSSVASRQTGVAPEHGSGPSWQAPFTQTCVPSQKSPSPQSAFVEQAGVGLKMGQPEINTTALNAIHNVPQRETPRTNVRSLLPSNFKPNILVDLQVRECGVFRFTRSSIPVSKKVLSTTPTGANPKVVLLRTSPRLLATAGQNAGTNALPAKPVVHYACLSVNVQSVV
jgi:hypothetical protein